MKDGIGDAFGKEISISHAIVTQALNLQLVWLAHKIHARGCISRAFVEVAVFPGRCCTQKDRGAWRFSTLG